MYMFRGCAEQAMLQDQTLFQAKYLHPNDRRLRSPEAKRQPAPVRLPEERGLDGHNCITAFLQTDLVR